jgi:hypothetical protein
MIILFRPITGHLSDVHIREILIIAILSILDFIRLCVVLCIVCFVLFYVLFVLCCSMYCLCVNVYCTNATGLLPNCS